MRNFCEFSSDDWRYGGFGQVYHMTYPVKEFDGQRYVELYIPARTAIILKETKEEKVEETVNPNTASEEAPKKTTRKKKTEEVKEEKVEE